jgi:hypothetical protein
VKPVYLTIQINPQQERKAERHERQTPKEGSSSKESITKKSLIVNYSEKDQNTTKKLLQNKHPLEKVFQLGFKMIR